MPDIRKLMAEIAKPEYGGKTPDEIVSALNVKVPIPPPPDPPTDETVAEVKGIGIVTIVDVKKAQKIASDEAQH